jgi:transposase
MTYCKDCIEKDLKIEELKDAVNGLKTKLRIRERRKQEGYFGLSTPSSKVPLKSNSEAKDNGGAKPGHTGYGRQSHTEETADEIVSLDIGDTCPECGGALLLKEARDRTVIEGDPLQPKKILYHLTHRECNACHKVFRAKAPSVLPKSLYGNQITSQMAVMHYMHGVPMGRIAEMTGINFGTLTDIFHRLSRYFTPVMGALKEAYRQSPVKHADETGWRNNGHNGYAWLFSTPDMSIFSFKDTRAASVPRSIFGEKELPGVLVVDRYNGYNKLPVQIQYCYAHLLRDVEKLAKDFPEEEVTSFTNALIPPMAEAMHLHHTSLSDEEYYEKAQETKRQIIEVIQKPAHHLGIRAIQDIFRDHEDRLYHWVKNRDVPADNNRAERDLRPTVIARKVSFGSGSDAGAHTRSVLMSALHTLNKRRGEQSLDSVFKEILDEIAKNPDVDLVPLILKPIT